MCVCTACPHIAGRVFALSRCAGGWEFGGCFHWGLHFLNQCGAPWPTQQSAVTLGPLANSVSVVAVVAAALLPFPGFPMRVSPLLATRCTCIMPPLIGVVTLVLSYWHCVCAHHHACCFTCIWVGVLCSCSSPSLLAALHAYWLLDWCFVTLVLYPSSRQLTVLGAAAARADVSVSRFGVSAVLPSTLYRPCALFSQCHSSLLLPDTSRATEVVVAGVMPVCDHGHVQHTGHHSIVCVVLSAKHCLVRRLVEDCAVHSGWAGRGCGLGVCQGAARLIIACCFCQALTTVCLLG